MAVPTQHRHRAFDPHAEAARQREALVQEGLLRRLTFPDGHVEYRAQTSRHRPKAA